MTTTRTDAAPGVVCACAAREDDVAAVLAPVAGGDVATSRTRAASDGVAAVLAGAVEALSEEVSSLSPEGLLARVVVLQRVMNACAAAQDAAIVTFMGPELSVSAYWTNDGERELEDARRSELGAALHWSEATAATRVETARMVARDLPVTSATAATGDLSPVATRIVVEGGQTLVAEVDAKLSQVHGPDAVEQAAALRAVRWAMLAAFETRVVAYAATHTPAFTRRRVRDVIVRIDPAGFTARRADAVRHRTEVTLRHELDGMSTLSATLPTERALVCWHAIDGIARDVHADRTQPLGFRRAQALVALITSGALHTNSALHTSGDVDGGAVVPLADAGGLDRAAHEPGAVPVHPAISGGVTATHVTRGHVIPLGSGVEHANERAVSARGAAGERLPVGVQLEVAVDLATLLGLADMPASVAGDAIVPADALRELLADATFVTLRRVITDPVRGHRLDTGVTRYALTDRERDRILARDVRCRFPDCGQPASRCDTDHATPYAVGGPSSTANLGALCTRHHQEKTHAGWQITASDTDGACTWRSPLGHTHEHMSVPVLPWTIDDVPGTDPVHELAQIADALDALGVHEANAWSTGVHLDTSTMRDRLDDAERLAHAEIALTQSVHIATQARRDGAVTSVLTHVLTHHATRQQRNNLHQHLARTAAASASTTVDTRSGIDNTTIENDEDLPPF